LTLLLVAEVALGDTDASSPWQVWHLWRWAGSGSVLGLAFDAGCFAWQAWHLIALAWLLHGRGI